ncbi:hypothetical protein Patl1_24405 [Pistacia atlantica]|uniref:Uncharacterized protein n=1 Tax=Pistacia atlantica TaxID=434234 RepID=A0ACC0ZZT5_9ROSI|nr:hypothetical protein Patl1_24405 [Pistacia atlantica]
MSGDEGLIWGRQSGQRLLKSFNPYVHNNVPFFSFILSSRIEQRLLRFLSRTLRFLHPSMKNFSRRFTQLLSLDKFRTHFFLKRKFSLNWQHQLCMNSRPNPDIKMLFTDHSCNPTANGARPPPTNSPLVGSILEVGAFLPIGAHGIVGSSSPGAVAGCYDTCAFLKHPRMPTGMTGMDYQSANSEHLIMKRIRTGQSDEWAQMLVTLAFGRWDPEKGWHINLSRFRIYQLLQCHCRWTYPWCCIFKTYSSDIYLQSNSRTKIALRGHEAPVYLVCPHHKANTQFIFSTAIDGKIKAWLYDYLGSRVNYDAPRHWCTMMAYSPDGTRKCSLGVVQFGTTRNPFLATGDEFQIKFWDMDNTNMLTAVDADNGLPVCSHTVYLYTNVSQVMTMFMPSPLATTFWHSILKKIILLPLGWRILPLRYRISELMRSEPNLRVTKIESQGFHILNFKCTGVFRS